MNIFVLDGDSFEEEFARAELVLDLSGMTKCSKCGAVKLPPEEHLKLRWRRGRFDNRSTVVGDFTWPSLSAFIVVRDEVKGTLAEVLPGSRFSQVHVIEAGTNKRPRRNPVERVPLWQITTPATVHLDMSASGRSITSDCAVCGRKTYSVAPGAKIVIDKAQLGEHRFFRIAEVGLPYFVTEDVADRLRQLQFSNLKIIPAGRLHNAAPV